MDAIQLLVQQHEDARAALRHIERAVEPEERIRLWRALKPELEHHEEMEETCLYGPLSREVNARHQRLAVFYEEHHGAVQQTQTLMEKLDDMDAAGPNWAGTLEQLRISLDTHIEQEEKQIFPLVQLVWDSSQLDQAGAKMQGTASDIAAKTEPPYSMPRGPKSELNEAYAPTHTSGRRLSELFGAELDFVRHRPGTALVAAATAGLLLGLLMTSRRAEPTTTRRAITSG